MSDPKFDALKVIAGADLDETYQIADITTGEMANWDDGGTYEAELVIRDRTAQQIARIANFGTRDGEITLLSAGKLRLQLAGAFTAEMPWTRVYTNSTDPRVAGWRSIGAHVFDLIVTEINDNDVSDLVEGKFVVQQPVS